MRKLRIFDESKTRELFESDLDQEKGFLHDDKLLISHHDELQEQAEIGHYEVVNEYDNGGKDMKWVVDTPYVPHQEAYDEYEDIQVYVPYTDEQLAEREIATLKRKLADTDYQAIKYAEGVMSASEYAPIKQQREDWRYRINYLQAYYNI
jgi:hypothetical protein